MVSKCWGGVNYETRKISIKNEIEIQVFSNKNRELICCTLVLKTEFFREKNC